MKKLLFLMFLTGAIAGILIQRYSDSHPFALCERFCGLGGQDHSDVLQESYGACICNNEEGHRIERGYHQLMNRR